MKIRRVTEGKKRWLDLLLLGDEQEDMIDRYLERGDMYVLSDGGEDVAACVVTREGDGLCEVKNIAVRPGMQGRGYGKRMLEYVCGLYSGVCSRMIVGTGDVPGATAFYRACGFTESHRIKDFFTDNYDHPIIEEGVLLKDMVYFVKELVGSEK